MGKISFLPLLSSTLPSLLLFSSLFLGSRDQIESSLIDDAPLFFFLPFFFLQSHSSFFVERERDMMTLSFPFPSPSSFFFFLSLFFPMITCDRNQIFSLVPLLFSFFPSAQGERGREFTCPPPLPFSPTFFFSPPSLSPSKEVRVFRESGLYSSPPLPFFSFSSYFFPFFSFPSEERMGKAEDGGAIYFSSSFFPLPPSFSPSSSTMW